VGEFVNSETAAPPADPAAASGVEAFGYRQELKRSLGLFDLLIYGLVFIVPTAPFPVFGIVFNASKGMVPLVYTVGLVAMLFTAFSYMTMSSAFPVAGSVYTYASRSLGEIAGFFAGWGILLDYLLTPTLIYVVCAIAIHTVVPGVPKGVWVVGLLSFSTVVNFFGIETATRVNITLLGLQLVLLAVFLILGIVALIHGVGGAHLSITPLYNAKVFSPSLVFGALSLAVLSFLGFDAISTLAEETKGGPHLVGRATMLSLCLAAFLFVAQTYLASLFVLGRTHFAPGDATETAFYGIVQTIGGPWFKATISILGVLVSGIPAALTAQAATARLLYGMARDGKLPKLLSHIEPVRKVPDYAIAAVGLVTLVLGLLLVSQLELLSSMVSFGALLGFFLLHCSVIAHGWRTGQLQKWVRFLVAPTIGLVIIAYVLVNAQKNAQIAGVGWLAFGVVILLVLKFSGRSTGLIEDVAPPPAD
jgi:amino acid transporter